MTEPGKFLKRLTDKYLEKQSPYDDKTLNCIRETVDELSSRETSADRPGMLLGMIQSGKTRTFIGVIAEAVDRGFNLFIVLTKGTNALTSQTYERIKDDFNSSIDFDELRVFDIMKLPKFNKRTLSNPIILVVKKEKRNLIHLSKTLLQEHPELLKRRTLIIDDEADFASVGFKRTEDEAAEAQTIMRMIDELRSGLKNSSFLQVTATPYSLYLQPAEHRTTEGEVFKPVRPAFTKLVPIHDRYIGGKYYFEDSQVPGSVPSFLHHPVEAAELDRLLGKDLRTFKPEEALTTRSVPALRNAVATFIVGGVLRRMQAKRLNVTPKKYSFIVHTAARKAAHEWQETVVEAIVEQLQQQAEHGTDLFKQLIREAYDGLAPSVIAAELWMPEYEDILTEVADNIDTVQVQIVNSDKKVMELLDRDGQLELRERLNIFIGGSILDRGLTIGNLIGFYYGRNATRTQQDTVLQHSRMYGTRPPEDLAVTRFYTSNDIYQTLKTIHEFDAGLREAFMKGHDEGVVFIRQEGNKIVPCSPNKVLVSSLTTLRPGIRNVPYGFQCSFKTKPTYRTDGIDEWIARLGINGNVDPILVGIDDAVNILKLVSETLIDDEDSGILWDREAYLAGMKYMSRINSRTDEPGKVHLLARFDRQNSRMREGGRFFNAPDTAHIEGVIARKVASQYPMLMLFRQEGLKVNGWRDCPFWWPALYAPSEMKTVVFASDTNTDDPADLTP